MLYYDYHFDISPVGLILDSELKLDKLPLEEGDIFVLVKVGEKIMFKKQSGITKFFVEGVIDGNT
jgi:hypothetical protein